MIHEDMRPCPLCGGSPIMVKTKNCGRYVGCTVCGVMTVVFDTDNTGSAYDKAKTAWNKRQEEPNMKNSKYIFKAIPRPGILDANDYSDDVPPAELTGYDGTYVYGWYVDGFIVGKVMDYHDEYIALEYWVPVDPETVCLVGKEVGHEKTVCD